MDEADRAERSNALFLGKALHAAQGAVSQMIHRESRPFCLDCDDAIPPKRLALGGVMRCIECQQDFDHRQHMKATHGY